MTTYTIELPDKCPRCKRNLTSLAKGGGHYAELIVCGGGLGLAENIPHRCPLVIIAGAERTKITVFGVACKDCVDKDNKRLLKAYDLCAPILEVAREMVEEEKG